MGQIYSEQAPLSISQQKREAKLDIETRCHTRNWFDMECHWNMPNLDKDWPEAKAVQIVVCVCII